MEQVYVHTHFPSDERAQRAVRALLDAGFPTKDIETRHEHDGLEPAQPLRLRRRVQPLVLRDSWIGALFGALPGALLGVVAPGLGPGVVAPGLDVLDVVFNPNPGLAMLQGLLWGGALGGFIGVFVGRFYWEEQPDSSRSGEDVFLGVHASEAQADRAMAALRETGAEQIETHGG